MPITKRKIHYGSPNNLISYILDEKHNGEKIGAVTSINCNVETASMEYTDIQNKYNMKGNRVAYHVIQSFSPQDNITVEEANEIGKRLCNELYSNFQCVISTHIDREHIHNHISINAINIKGRKLEDRLINKKEGLYALSDTSDKIAAQYGCFILPRKTYLKNKNKNYYYQFKEQTWKQKIKEDIDKIIGKSNTLEEFLDKLSMYYEVKKGKHISVKAIGMKKFTRLSTIDRLYSEENLYFFFKNRNNIKLANIDTRGNGFNNTILMKVQESKDAIEKSQLGVRKQIYTEYQKTKYEEVKRFYFLKKQLECLEKYQILSFKDLEDTISMKRSEIKNKNSILKKNKNRFDKIIEIQEKAQDYIQLHKIYEYAMFYKEQDKNYILPQEVNIFFQLQEELQIDSVEGAKQLIKSLRQERININKLRRKVVELQSELNLLDSIKDGEMSKEFIHNIKFGKNRIDYNLSNDSYFCVNLPYTKEKIYVEKKHTTYNEKKQFYKLYLIDDKQYEVFDENNNKITNISGTELEKYVSDKKKENDKNYSEIKIV